MSVHPHINVWPGATLCTNETEGGAWFLLLLRRKNAVAGPAVRGQSQGQHDDDENDQAP